MTVHVKCYVGVMQAGGKETYLVCLERNGKQITPYEFNERYKAEYEVASFNHLINDGTEPDILAYNKETEGTHPSYL